MSEAASSVPSWAQEVGIFAVASVSIVVAIYKYVTTQLTKEVPPPVGASHVIESKLLRELIDALREHSEEDARVALRLNRGMGELREAVLEMSEVAKSHTEASIRLLQFMHRNQE
jgi:glycyl-tRNA synthetase (class II)